MTVLLTGATGFVGGAVLVRLAETGRPVRVLVRDPGRLALRGRGIEICPGSLGDPESLARAARCVTAVVHAAGVVAPRRRRDFDRINRNGTAALAEALRRAAPAARWVQISSLAAAGPGAGREGALPRPVSAYGRSKLAVEQTLKGLEAVVLRPPSVYGPGDSAFLPFFRAVAGGRRVPVPRVPGQRLSFVHVDDLAGAVLAALEAPRPPEGGPLYPSHPEQVGLAGFLDALGAALGRRPRPLHVGPGVVRALALTAAPWRALTGRPKYLSLDKVHEILASDWSCDPGGAQAALGWQARYDLRSGLAQTARAYRDAGLLAPPAAVRKPEPDSGGT